MPTRGPRVYSAIADARSRAANKSPIEPPPHAVDALADNPAGAS